MTRRLGLSHTHARELKKGSAELLILSLVETRARHGYEIGKLIEQRSGGAITFSAPRTSIRRRIARVSSASS